MYVCIFCWYQKEFVSGDRIFGVLCAETSTAVSTRKMEGWLPLRILTVCDPGIESFLLHLHKLFSIV